MNKTVKLNNFEFSNYDKLNLIAGPCVLESHSHAKKMVEALLEITTKLKINFVYKTSFDKANRTSLHSERGLGIDASLEIFKSLKDEYKINILTDVHNVSDCEKLKDYVDILREILNDKGAKAQIIRKYVPIMNSLINKYLQAMDFYISFNLDEEFNETVKSRFRDTFNYNNFSEGEKMRIDLALLFTWRDIARMKNSTNTNLLILDEIFDSSLDGQGTDDFFKIIKTLEKENIFIISHKGDILFDKFTNIIKYEKVQNFTQLGTI